MGFLLHLQQTHHDGCVEEASLCVSRSSTAKYRENLDVLHLLLFPCEELKLSFAGTKTSLMFIILSLRLSIYLSRLPFHRIGILCMSWIPRI